MSNEKNRPTILRQVRRGTISVDGIDYQHPCFEGMENVTIDVAWKNNALHAVLPGIGDGEEWVELNPVSETAAPRRFFGGFLADPLCRLLDAMALVQDETEYALNLEVVDNAKAVLRDNGITLNECSRLEDNLYLAAFIGPLLGEIDKAHSQQAYVVPGHDHLVGQVRNAVIRLLEQAQVLEIFLPPSFPELLVPDEVETLVKQVVGLSFWQAGQVASERGYRPSAKRLGNHGEDIWGFGMDVGGMVIPYMVKLGLGVDDQAKAA